jgi:hypothetical protein
VRGDQCVLTKSSFDSLLKADYCLSDRLIISKDHASVQFTVADVDENGRALSTGTNFALSGQVRAQGESDDSINRLATKAGRAFCDSSFYLSETHDIVQSSGTSGPTRSDSAVDYLPVTLVASHWY